MSIKLPEWSENLFQPYRYKIMYGGRGSAKSYSAAMALLLMGYERKHRILCAREYQNSISDSVIRLLADMINSAGLDDFYEVQRDRIIGRNGTEFIFKGIKHNIQSIKSLAGITVCWVEEGQTISAESWSVLIPTIREPGSEIWVTMNPNMETDPTYQRFIVDPPPSAWVRRINYEDNPWFPEELRAEMEWDKSRDFDKYRHVWLGECVQHTEARVFNNWRVEEIEPPRGVTYYFGADWGFAKDPTVLNRMWVDMDKRLLVIDYEAHKVGCEIDHTPALFDTIPESRRFTIRADGARPETISYMRRAGFKIEAAKKGAGSVEDGVGFMKSLDIIIHPRCKRTIDEFSHYSYKIDKLTEDILPVIVDKHNHHIDGIRYALRPMMPSQRANVAVPVGLGKQSAWRA